MLDGAARRHAGADAGRAELTASAADGEATYTVKEVTPQSGVSHTFAFDPSNSTATVSLDNTYLRWLQVNVDQYAPGGVQVGTTQYLGMLSTPNTIMAVPLPSDPTDFPFTFYEGASRAVVTLGGLGQAPFDWTYDRYGIGCTMVFDYAIPTIFIALGVAVDQGGTAWTTPRSPPCRRSWRSWRTPQADRWPPRRRAPTSPWTA